MANQHTTMRLYDKNNDRLYLNAEELQAFVTAAMHAPSPQRRFALTLAYTGCRVSEARQLHGHCFQLQARVLSIRSLKKRDVHAVREVPIPAELAQEFEMLTLDQDKLIWSEAGVIIPRIKAYRWIKVLMACAGITGSKASPKGLRHAFGARAIANGIPLHMVQKWMGHSSMNTTAIYSTLMGPEELQMCDQMWEAHFANGRR